LVAYFPDEAGLPISLSAGTLAVVGPRESPKWALLRCPCGKGHVIRLNLSATSWPSWRVFVGDDGLPTLRPSVNLREKSQRCHFVLSRGQVFWAR
jgi:hypothetical protein